MDQMKLEKVDVTSALPLEAASPTGVDPWVDRGTCSPTLLFEVEGTTCVLSSYFFGDRHFLY